MTVFLFADLMGPIASWGDVAVGEVRASRAEPSRSAMLGIVAAALGVPRTDRLALAELRDTAMTAAVVRSYGHPLIDYHTIETPHGARSGRTRRHELMDRGRTGTMQTYRHYQCDAWYQLVLWARDEQTELVDRVMLAMIEPGFAIALGRRSCTMALPMAPRLVEARSLTEAVLIDDAAQQERWLEAGPRSSAWARFVRSESVTILAPHEPDGDAVGGWSRERWDEPRYTPRPSFEPRSEHVWSVRINREQRDVP